MPQFVAAEFGIGGTGNRNHVFEISARRAFTAANFIIEQQHKQELNITGNKAVRALAQEALGIDWEKDLEDITIEQLEKKAGRLWEKSGFDKFLEEAISALMLEAAPRSIISALTIARRRLSELNNDVQLRSSAVNQDARKIKSEIENLTNDLDVLQKKSIELKSKLDSIKIDLNKKLNLKLKELNFKATQSIDYYFLSELAKRIAEAYPSNPIEKFLRIVEQIQLVILKTILASVRIPFLEGLEIIPESLAQLFKYEVVLRNKNELEFRSKREAEDFAERLVVEAKQIVETILSQKLSEIEIEIIAHNRELHQALRENTAEVIQKARRRLNQDFTVHLELPALLSEEIESSLEISSNNTINKNKNFDILKAIVNFFRGFFDKNYTEDNEYT